MRRSFLNSNILLCSEFRPNGIVKLEDPPEELSAVFRHAPAPCTRDLGHQMAYVESLEQAPHSRAGTSSLGWFQESTEQGFPDVAVAKAARDVVAIQNRPEPAYVVTPRRVEAGVAVAVDYLRLGQLPQFRVGRRRIVHHRQRVQIAAVAGQGLLLIVDQRRHALGHGIVAY